MTTGIPITPSGLGCCSLYWLRQQVRLLTMQYTSGYAPARDCHGDKKTIVCYTGDRNFPRHGFRISTSASGRGGGLAAARG